MQSPILQLFKVILFWLFFGINLIFLSYFSISTLTDFMNPAYPWGSAHYVAYNDLSAYNPQDALWDYIINACLFGFSALIGWKLKDRSFIWAIVAEGWFIAYITMNGIVSQLVAVSYGY